MSKCWSGDKMPPKLLRLVASFPAEELLGAEKATSWSPAPRKKDGGDCLDLSCNKNIMFSVTA